MMHQTTPPRSSRPDPVRILIAGEAGQKVRYAGAVLARAAADQGRVVVESSLFGAAVKKGEVTSHVQISRAAIDYPFVEGPDALVVASQAAYDRHAMRQPDATLVFYDSSCISPVDLPGVEQMGVPAAGWLLERVGHTKGATLMLIAALAEVTGIVPFDALQRHATTRSPRRRAVNLLALADGRRFSALTPATRVCAQTAPAVEVDPAKCEMARLAALRGNPSPLSSPVSSQTCRICELICPELAITRHEETQEVRFDTTHCKACGLCAHFCPREAIVVRGAARP